MDVKPLNIENAFSTEPDPLDFVFNGFLSGTVGALVAPGASGKSFLALEIALAVAAGEAGADIIRLRPESNGRVVYFALEDPESVLHHRLHALSSHLSTGAREAVVERLDLLPLLGSGLDVMNSRHFDGLKAACEGARLVIFDTLSRLHKLDENSNSDMSELLQSLEILAKRTGAAILYLHHTSKSVAFDNKGDNQHAARGASLLTDNARFAAFVSRMTKEQSFQYADAFNPGRPIGEESRGYYVRFGVSKCNYSAPLNDRWFRREQGGVLVPCELVEVPGVGKGRLRSVGGGKYRESDDV